MKKIIVRITTTCLFLACCDVICAQHNLFIHTKGVVGSFILEWSAENLGRNQGVKSSGNLHTLGAGVGYHWFFREDFFCGLEYNYCQINFDNNHVELAEKGRLHEGKFHLGYFRENGIILNQMKVRKFHLGYSAMSTKHTNPYLIAFTSPYELRSGWSGLNAGMEFGRVFEFGIHEHQLQLLFNYEYTKLFLVHAWTYQNDRDIKSSGDLGIFVWGLKLSVLLRDIQFRRIKEEE